MLAVVRCNRSRCCLTWQINAKALDEGDAAKASFPSLILHNLLHLLLCLTRKLPKSHAHPGRVLHELFTTSRDTLQSPKYAFAVTPVASKIFSLIVLTRSSVLSRSFRLNESTQSLKQRSTTLLYILKLQKHTAHSYQQSHERHHIRALFTYP